MAQAKEIYYPPKELVENSNIKKFMDKHGIKTLEELLEKSQKNIEWWWEENAKELEWFSPWKKVLEWNLPFAKWFVDGKINIVHNALDRHIKTYRKNKVAYIFEGEPGEVEYWSYYKLYKEVNKLANALKKLGIKKGDRVTIYLPMIPQLPIAMLACAKIGAIHSVVFSGFSSQALKDRIIDAEAKVLITADGGYRRGKIVPLKANSDEALKECPTVEKVIVYKRTGENVPMKEGRDLWWHEITEKESDYCETEIMDSEDILYILYTSGTTGKPKG
ncbi:MAG: AMP-binding protein, partial [candidate division WOR-3 bacterium]